MATCPAFIGTGGSELAFAATRSLTVCLALHAAILSALGSDMQPALEVLKAPAEPDVTAALEVMHNVITIVTTGRRMQGVAEAIALGLSELARLPCYSLEGGQLRHGPMEVLSPGVGVVLFRSQEASSNLVAALARSVAEAGSPAVIFDASGAAPVPGIITVPVTSGAGMAAIFALLGAAQRFMVDFAALRVANVGTPQRSQKITRSE